jgi:hypothetical protein
MKMPTITGLITAVSVKERETKYGKKDATSFNINNEWYSGGFKTYTVDKGDEVEMTFAVNAKGYKDIQAINVISKGAGPTATNTGTPRIGRTFPVDPLAPERTINRQNALTAAVNSLGSCIPGEDIDEHALMVISIARKYEAYTTGDLDKEEAMAMVQAGE